MGWDALEDVEREARRYAALDRRVDAVVVGVKIDRRWRIACQGQRASGTSLGEAIARLGVCDE